MLRDVARASPREVVLLSLKHPVSSGGADVAVRCAAVSIAPRGFSLRCSIATSVLQAHSSRTTRSANADRDLRAADRGASIGCESALRSCRHAHREAGLRTGRALEFLTLRRSSNEPACRVAAGGAARRCAALQH
ncbi:hypothetical protein ACFJIW_19535 [Tahibacter sp. UC22_41]|uniref:hypothetical protein n=1 Tax=Tahibacter sp. UC22_41 TaxID=3350178 RepID=UPI0036DDED2B